MGKTSQKQVLEPSLKQTEEFVVLKIEERDRQKCDSTRQKQIYLTFSTNFKASKPHQNNDSLSFEISQASLSLRLRNLTKIFYVIIFIL